MPRPRTWTDEQLIAATATATSWGDVIRSLGLTRGNTAYRTIQGHVLRLGLNVTHLPPMAEGVVATAQPGVPYETQLADLAQVVPLSRSWADVFRRMGVSVNGAVEATARRLAANQGIDTSHFLGQAWMSRPVETVADMPFTREPSGNQLHRSGPAVAAAWFLARGYAVSVPLEPVAYDLVVESDDGLRRVQVKTTTYRDPDSGRYAVGLRKSNYGGGWSQSCGRQGGARAYRKDEIDFFFIVAGDGAGYLIPVQETDGCLQLVLDRKYMNYRVE